MSDDIHIDSDSLRQWVERSQQAQERAYDRQDAEHAEKCKKVSELRCVGCSKALEWCTWGDNEADGYFYQGALLSNTVGFGSCQHDMARVTLAICDDCITERCISSDWMRKLGEEMGTAEEQERRE